MGRCKSNYDTITTMTVPKRTISFHDLELERHLILPQEARKSNYHDHDGPQEDIGMDIIKACYDVCIVNVRVLIFLPSRFNSSCRKYLWI
jgi:hypothetical protein